MTLRQKFVVAFAVVAAVVTALMGAVSYTTTQRTLHSEISDSLGSAMTTLISGGTLVAATPTDPGHVGGTGHDGDGDNDGDYPIVETAQAISSDGQAGHLSGATVALPVDARVLELAHSKTAGQRFDERVMVGDKNYQMLTQSLGGTKGAISVGRDLGESDRILNQLAITTALVGLGVLILAGAAGWLLARRITRRLTRLTMMAETVSATGHLDVDFAMRGRDEVGRLSSSLQGMMVELLASKDAQQRLVQNAGHELRTPLTSLRTNLSVLRRFSELSPDSQRHLLDDVEGESRELTAMVNELVELATDRKAAEDPEPTDLTALAERVAQMFRRRSGRDIQVIGEPGIMIQARPNALERAVSNLLDNATKFDIGGKEPIEVRVASNGVDVLDRGPGLTPADAGRIFDRFFRADSARSMPGSGLGLAIVGEVATLHGGTVHARPRSGGGAEIGFTLGASTFLPNSKPQTVLNKH